MMTRSGRIVTFASPAVSASPWPATSVKSPIETLQPPSVDAAGLRVHQVRHPEEVGHVGGRRGFVDLLRRPDLLDAALRHHRDAVGHREGLLLVVRHVDERDADLFLEGLQLDLEALAELGVEGAERLVQQEDLGVQDQGPGERDALLLAAGKLVRAPLRELRHLDELEGLAHAFGRLLFGGLLVLEPEGDVLLHREVREERVVLEDRVDVALVGRGLGHVDLVEEDLALGRALEARDHAQGGRFAAARGAEEREELARRHIEVDPCDRGELTEALHQIDELDLSACHRARSIHSAPPRESTGCREARRGRAQVGGPTTHPWP